MSHQAVNLSTYQCASSHKVFYPSELHLDTQTMTETFINQRPKFSFIKTDDYSTPFQENFDFGPPPTGRFASFYELSLDSSSPPSKLFDVYDTQQGSAFTQLKKIPRETHSPGEGFGPRLETESQSDTPIPPTTVHVVYGSPIHISLTGD